jgi:hypothetical protein
MVELTTSQAVRAYGTHPNVLNRLILLGRLQAHKDADGRWLISRESLENWNARRVRRVPKAEAVAAAR